MAPAFAVVAVVGLLAAPMAFAQADMQCVTIQNPNPLLGGQDGQIGMTITNLGPGPDPGISAQLIFPDPIEFYIDEPTEENPWQWEISQGAENTCGLFIDQRGDGGADDGIDWNDAYFYICGDPEATDDDGNPLDPIGVMVSGDSVTFTSTLPLKMDPPPFSVFRINSPDSVAGDMTHNTGLFGAPVNEFDALGDLQLVNDGGANPTEGCNPPLGFTPGNIALIDRGTCEFGEKAVFAESVGATAVVIANHNPEQDITTFLMAPGAFGAAVTVPVIMISTQDGDALKAAMTGKAAVNTWVGHEFPDGDWEIPMISLVYNQLGDPNEDNDVDRTGVAVSPGGPAAPTAAFSFAPESPTVGETVTFTDESTGGPTSWAWDFGDGETSTDQNPTHAYAAEGTYTVSLSATNDIGSDTTTLDVVVTGEAPVLQAAFSFAPDAPGVGEDVAFTDMSTGAVTTWAWDFGDGETSADQNPTHAFAAAGTYTVSLTVGDGTDTSTATHEVTVTEAPVLQAAFGFTPDAPTVGEDVMFTDMSTGAVTTWAWDFGDGETSADQNPTHAFAAAGTFTVSLTVGDGTDTSTATNDVTVSEGVQLTQRFFVAAAAFAAGDVGTFWVTDVDVHNSGDTMPMHYAFVWLPRNTDNSDPMTSEMFTLGPGMSARYANVLSEVFGLEEGALGALEVVADTDAARVMSRTFNQPSGKQTGTFGQGIPGRYVGFMIAPNSPARILFMTENDAFRGNLGLLNGSSSAMTVRYQRYQNDGTALGTVVDVELPPFGNTQVNRVFSEFTPMDGGYVVVWTETEGVKFTCYGSVVDAVTGDPTTIMPQL